MRRVNIGMIGAGTVGGGVVQGLLRNGALMAGRLGVELHIQKIAVRNLKKARNVPVPKRLLTTDWKSVVEDPAIELIVELIGGTTTARDVVRAALTRGKSVVTANKALLSKHGEELFSLARKHKANLYYEASVAGGIPIIKVLREAMIGNRITRLYGIVNGTCNYILTRMKREGADFDAVLADAQRLGYAEAEPSLDVDGHDAAHKTGILASLAHGFWVQPQSIHTEGIRNISRLDIEYASFLGYSIKLLGIVKTVPVQSGRKGALKNRIQVSVYPALVPDTHVLASVNDVYNAVFIRGDVVGDTLYYGRGAGQDATASAVLSDLGDAALDLAHGSHGRIPAFTCHDQDGAVLPISESISRYYLRLEVEDKPGVLAKIATILGKSRIGISSVIQPEGHAGASVPLILMIHNATHAAMTGALKTIASLPAVKGKPNMIRVETFD